MKNLFDTETQKEFESRITALKQDSNRLWGKMSVNEMICHCSDQIKMATGEIPTKYVGNIFLNTVAKHLILLGVPAPKGKVETVPQLKQGLRGTKPTNFGQDKNGLLGLIKNFESLIKQKPDSIHPAFGKMNKTQWARLSYLHLNHHLKQFNC